MLRRAGRQGQGQKLKASILNHQPNVALYVANSRLDLAANLLTDSKMRPAGLEPAAYNLGGCRSIHLSYGRNLQDWYFSSECTS